ncbi:DegT/DnrJ/EryC1/StrS family aminotransferase [Bacteroides hominis]|uniref:DegT/DnrJ/EryC1/StrS family aminotransferase n=1 Tax=Bacteroides hominis TaxID=2763023 RepID=UPI003D6CC1FF
MRPKVSAVSISLCTLEEWEPSVLVISNKTITTGGGGMLLFQDEELGKFAEHLTTQAKVPHRWAFVHYDYNYRMPNINAALGWRQMESLTGMLSINVRQAERYREFFSDS